LDEFRQLNPIWDLPCDALQCRPHTPQKFRAISLSDHRPHLALGVNRNPLMADPHARIVLAAGFGLAEMARKQSADGLENMLRSRRPLQTVIANSPEVLEYYYCY
jgi:hypothetical protein